MINANELRIGNWFLNGNNHSVQVGYHEIRYATINPGTQNNYRPIPLTPEILEKCGFEKWNDRDKYQLDCEDGENIQVTGNEIFLAGNDAAVEGHGFHCKAESLHQLQNLYFALTGKELPVTL